MSNPIPVERFTQQLLVILGETFENVRGIFLDKNTSLFETLATITAEMASRPVSADCATLAAQVKHVRFYLDILEQIMQGKEVGKVDWGEIWRSTREVTPTEWEAIQSDLKASYQRIVNTIQTRATWEGEYALVDVMAVLAHSAYHLGEIRQALCVLRPTA